MPLRITSGLALHVAEKTDKIQNFSNHDSEKVRLITKDVYNI